MTGVFLDTSVLVPGLMETGPESESPQRILEAVAEGRIVKPRTAWHCCLEFYSLTTRLPPEYRLEPEQALDLLEYEILDRFVVGDLAAIARRHFLRVSVAEGIAGGRIYDAHIGEVARRMKAGRFVTDNLRHFLGLRRHGIDVLDSRTFAAML